ncbi:histone-lysine N-methyltransferase ASHH1-like isoform X1 [Actinidia eriantha]|uniref:histone-lysine N-methyltransferase ASHH1-like isoform X1 n=1 Tax=Actinidia eriantha TaxID=165200 RepID=UPI002585DD3E|nr:histone-lysine N-methyltransferase ASHH1-like isoform X1 [Actinidia eriantha]XP_057490389.1 histone-lysine N-methyltransferase ASHH1-like isoform X1 [Actinidia eriantha]XP_057490390.1 histone-lysine N-methyltransferase ASHH1-like isoform X1 [Actinidia eriantha]XP_057490391.1 histone-lysine N-methyltransferase ASHH1-like isoform X1 [Actinidia eriantha]
MVQLSEGVPPFILINQNDFSGRKHKKLKEEDIAICECKYDANDPDSACGERCLNVLTSTECTSGYCPCSDYCKNQRFQKSEYAKTKLFKTEGRGWGLLADENIKAGRFIIEYCGELISSEEAKQRSLVYEAQGLKDAYIISLYANYFVDATKKGSLARFINRSCQPNCETRKWTVLGEVRVGIFAKQDIYAGTELAYEYNFEWYGGANVRCLCGAPNCSKFLGAKSPAFLEHNHVWEEGDDRYTVEAIPLYDSAEDEPSSLKLPKDQSSFTLDFLAKNDTSMVTVYTAGPEHQLESSAAVVEPLHSVPTEGVAINTVKTESNEEKKIYSKDTQSTFPPTNATASQFQSSSAFRNFQIGSGSLPKKKSFSAKKKTKNNGGKQLDGNCVARLFASKQAQEEILKCEEIRNQAAAKLEASYDEIRPAIEEHERDSQDNVDISAAMTWIGASCAKMKADFNFHFAIVKNVVCPQLPQSTCGEAKPSEGAENENGAKY